MKQIIGIEIIMTIIIFTIFLGSFVGILSSLLGLGGGVFFVTILPMLYEGIDHKTAIGTSLASVFFIVSLNTLQFHKRNLVSWATVFQLTPAALFTAFFAGNLAHKIPNEILISLMAGVLGFLSFSSFIKKPKRTKPASFVQIHLLGIYAGGISGLTGIGSGAVTSTCFLNWNLLPNPQVSPTSNAVMVITNLAGLIAYLNLQEISFEWSMQMGFVRWDIALSLFVSSFLTTFVGVRLQSRLSENARRLSIAYLLLILCAYECYQFYQFLP